MNLQAFHDPKDNPTNHGSNQQNAFIPWKILENMAKPCKTFQGSFVKVRVVQQPFNQTTRPLWLVDGPGWGPIPKNHHLSRESKGTPPKATPQEIRPY